MVFPLVRRQFALCMLLAVSGSILVFDQFYVLTKGGPGTATETLVQYIYTNGFQNAHIGYASAASMVLMLILMAIALIQPTARARTLVGKTSAW
ncbi:sugar ABC transporter permease [Bacillus sp. S34]|nr:sugar ABC transporter permease [Bacillus sp. S34]